MTDVRVVSVCEDPTRRKVPRKDVLRPEAVGVFFVGTP